MISNNNHIDHWLQQSAALGTHPFENADWIAMKQLLEKKRKKRLLIIWLIVGMFLLGLIISLLWINHKSYRHTPNMITHSKKNTEIEKEIVPEHIDTVKQNLIISNKEAKAANETHTQDNKQELTANPILTSTFKKTTTIATPKSTSANNIKTTIKIAQNDILLNNHQKIRINPQQKTKNISNVNAVLDALTASSDDIIKTYIPTIKYMHNRYIDSLINKTISQDSIATVDTTKKPSQKADSTSIKKNKRTTKPKNYFELSSGYAAMNIGNELQTGLVKLNYSAAVTQHLFIDFGMKGFLFNTNKSQKHKNIYNIIPVIPGTIYSEVDFKETEYTPDKGLAIEPGIGFHYQLKKLEMGIAVNYGNIINKENNIISYTDSFNLYNPLPTDIKVGGGTYSNNNFIGKNYATLSFQCAYSFIKRWKLQASYAYLIWHNKVEGVLEDNRKRGSFYFTVGYRF